MSRYNQNALIPRSLKNVVALGSLTLLTLFGIAHRDGLADTAGRAFNSVDLEKTSLCVAGASVLTGTDYDSHMPTVRFIEQSDPNDSTHAPNWGQDVPGATQLNQHVRLVYIDRGCQPDNTDGGLVALTFEGENNSGQEAVEVVVYDVNPNSGVQVVADQVSPVTNGHDTVAGGQWSPNQDDAQHATYTLSGPDGTVLSTVNVPIGSPVVPTPGQ